MSKPKSYSPFEVHKRLNTRAGRKLTTYEFNTLVSCWRTKKGLPDEEQLSFTESELNDFLAYAY